MDALVVERILSFVNGNFLPLRRVCKMWKRIIDEKCYIEIVKFDKTKTLPFKNICSMNINISKLDNGIPIENLKRLFLRHQEIIPSIIQKFTSLESLILEKCYFDESLDLSPFRHLTELRCESLGGTIEPLYNLKSLSVDSPLQSSILTPLKKLEKLKCSHVIGDDEIPSLRSLTISQNSDDFLEKNNMIATLILFRFHEEIEMPSNIKHLEIYSSSKPTYIESKTLKSLILFNTSITDISHLTSLEVIKTHHPLTNLNIWRFKKLRYLTAPSMKGLNLPNGNFRIEVKQKYIKIFKLYN